MADVVDVEVDDADGEAVQHDVAAVVVGRDDGVVLGVEPVEAASGRVDAQADRMYERRRAIDQHRHVTAGQRGRRNRSRSTLRVDPEKAPSS